MPETTELSISELRKNRGASVLSSDQPDGKSDAHDNDNGNGSTFASRSRASAQAHPLATRPATQTRALQRATPLEFDTQPEGEAPMNLPFDPMRVVEAVLRNWWLCLLIAIAFGGGVGAFMFTRPHTIATIELIKKDAPTLFRATEGGESYKPPQYADGTLVNLMKSPEVVRRVSARTPMVVGKMISGAELGRQLLANQEPQSDLVQLAYKGDENMTVASKLVYIFGEEIVQFMRELQAREGNDIATFIGKKLEIVERDLADNEKQLASVPPELRTLDSDQQLQAYLKQLTELDTQYSMAEIDVRAANPLQEKLQTEKDALVALQAKYTDENPLVQDQMAKIKAMEKQADNQNKGPTPKGFDGKTALSNYAPSKALLMKLEQIDKLRKETQKKIDALSHNNMGYVIIEKPAHGARSNAHDVDEPATRGTTLRAGCVGLLPNFSKIRTRQ